MSTRFDNEQKEAINATGTSVLVSASAGAGKTGVLVARLIKRCLDDRIPISRILAITFTEAAASEMKKRLAAGLHDRAASGTTQDEINWINDQLIALDTAKITTIDSYCLSIIQKYCNVIGLDPATGEHILSGGQVEAYKKQAFEDAVNAYEKNHHDLLLAVLETISPRPEDYDTLYDALEEIVSHASASDDEAAWYGKAKEAVKPVRTFRQLPEGIKKEYLASFDLRLHTIEDALVQMKERTADNKKLKTELIDAKLACTRNCEALLEESSWEPFRQGLIALAEQKTPPLTKDEVYTAIRKNMDAALKACVQDAYSEDVLVQDANEVGPLIAGLIDLAQLYEERFQQLKRRDACMDFSDMEHYALAILRANNGETAAAIRDTLDEIMVDEFQDTSVLQNTIIEAIARPDNVFRVGDVKQSIYRFRQAKPDLMRSLMKDPANRCITLRHNYRSMASIIEFTNRLFVRAMNVPSLKDSYGALDTVTPNSDRQKEDPVPVEFINVTDDPEDELTSKQLKSTWIASRILEEKQNDPSLKFSDFCILTRGHADKTYLRSAFDAASIPYDIDAREGFFQSRMVLTVTAFCRALSNPSDAIALTSVLTSSFYSFTDEELARMVIDGGSLVEGLKIDHPEVIEELNELRTIAAREGIDRFLSELARRHDFLERQSRQEQANFDALFDKVIAGGFTTLADLVEYMNSSENESSSQAISKGRDADVVTVTTIHHSKGLQYKFVFLWSTSRNSYRDRSQPLIVDDELYAGINRLDTRWSARRPSVYFTAIANKGNREDLEEFTRLLYVAITRAEKRLIIVDAGVKKPDASRPVTLSLLNQRGGMSALILSCMIDNDMLRYEEIAPADITNRDFKPEVYAETLPRYQGEAIEETIDGTPSGLEYTVLPPLDLAQEYHTGTNYGTLLHESVEKLPNRMWTEDDLSGLEIPETGKKAILAFGNSDLYRQALQMEIHKEFPFYYEEGNRTMHGSMDFVAIGEDHILLIDFKTDAKTPEAIRKAYSGQLNAYRHALEVLFHRQVDAYAWSFHNNCSVMIDPEQ